MALWSGKSSGVCSLSDCSTQGQRIGGPLKDRSNVCRKRIALFGAGDWKRAVRCGRMRSEFFSFMEDFDRRLPGFDTGCVLRHEWLFKLGTRFSSNHQTKKYQFFARSTRRVPKGDYWTSEFSEASTETRSFRLSKSVKAPANFNRSEQSGNGNGQPKNEQRGENGDLEAVMVTSEIAAVAAGDRNQRVIGIGARACAIVNFCQQSSLLPSAQFWMYGSDSALQNFQLSDHLECSISLSNTAETEGNQDIPIIQSTNPRTLFLVLGAGTGAGIGSASRQIKAARAKGWLVVGIFIQPFTFEGQKRLDQANELIESLVECTDMVLVVEQDALLRGEAVTVSDASDMANNAVLSSITAISEISLATTGVPNDDTGMVQISGKLLENSGKGWLGSGKGQNVKEAIEKSLFGAPAFDSPLLGGKLFVICTVANAAAGHTREDMAEAVSVLRDMLGSEVKVVPTAVTNSTLERSVKLVTIIITRLNDRRKLWDEHGLQDGMPSTTSMTGSDGPSSPQPIGSNRLINARSSSIGNSTRGSLKGGLSTLSRTLISSVDNESESSSFVQEKSRVEPQTSKATTDGASFTQKENRTQGNRSPGKKATVRSYRTTTREDRRRLDARPSSPQAPLSSSASKRSWLAIGWESGPSSAVAEAWAQARADARRPAKVVSTSDAYLPVGVRLSSDQAQISSSESFDSSFEVDATDRWATTDPVPVDPDAVPRNRMMDMGLGAVMGMYNAASALVMGKETTNEGRRPSLTQRASSMLESERSQKKLTPMVEMEFKNGVYKGRCLTGLPDGKGRLTFSDGSFYDGQWKLGRRAGAGAFYYANGDLFQGSWKDDVMHGKGWMYYHNGDRLYANFWKGKAHGEGRFYAAQGNVFFGQFRENWRHGECLHIEASGVRWTEIWQNGIFMSRTPDDS